MAKSPPPKPNSVMEIVTQKGLTVTYICARTGLNQRTVKSRLEAPWLCNVVEIIRLARLFEMTPEALFSLIMTQANAEGELNPDKLPKSRKPGRPKRAVSAQTESAPQG